ncbi:MAG: 4-alpha-glucanotransferase [Pseudomonadota bacterium]
MQHITEKQRLRSAGIILHPTSLPSEFGIGDLGPSLYKFLDFTAKADLTLWQVLPLSPADTVGCPYVSWSSISGNTLLIDPINLKDLGLIEQSDLEHEEFDHAKVDFEIVQAYKIPLLKKAASSLMEKANKDLFDEFQTFKKENEELFNHCLYSVIKDQNEQKPWWQWSQELKRPIKIVINELKNKYAQEIDIYLAMQFLFFRQWNFVKKACEDKSISIIGDIPIYVSRDSADAWLNQNIFKIDEEGNPSHVSGVPPDAYAKKGQLWNTPVYDWEKLKKTNYDWWIRRITGLLKICHIVRIDHFRAFSAYWEIPAVQEDARLGKWVEGPGKHFFEAMKKHFGFLPFIVEDLGEIDLKTDELRTSCNLPGSKVLQFAFGGGSWNPHLPHNYDKRSVAYTSTHDSETMKQYWSNAPEHAKEEASTYLHSNDGNFVWRAIDAVFASVSDFAIIPLQDFLVLGAEARMNIPGTVSKDNWSWRMRKEDMSDDLAISIKRKINLYGRNPKIKKDDPFCPDVTSEDWNKKHEKLLKEIG